MSRSLPVWCGVLWAVCLFFIGGGHCQAEDELPFEVGEKITYQLKWGIIPAGTVVLEVLPLTTIDGQPARHFRMTARSNGVIDTFYKVRDSIDGYTDLGLNHSLKYLKKQREGSSNQDVAVRFDTDKQTAQYHNLKKEEPRPSLVIPAGTFDPFSVIYYCRLFDFSVAKMVERPVTDGKKSVLGRLENRGRQTLIIDDTSYDTFLIEPDIKDVGGVFKKSDDANILIWMSADQRCIPVKLKSKVIVGSFTAEMISYQPR
ncbi:MAG: DUF3108 domain-containing protein [Proteobacteria bacterium]|nr:DUF3108 domain-containing protein [Pseudomonadota bacterium]MBU1641509.1 DUF3108 domain-containing protein [Pseudomonadota bacterium]